MSTTTLPAWASSFQRLPSRSTSVELGHGPCRRPGLDDVGRGGARREGRAKRPAAAATPSARRRVTAGRAFERAHSCILGDTAIWCRGRATGAARSTESTPMTDPDRRASSRARSPTPGRSGARRAARGPAERRAEVLLRRPRLAPVRGDHRARRSTTRPAPRRRSSPPTAPRCAPRSAPARVLVDLGAGNCAKAVSLFPVLRAEALCRGRRLGRVPARRAAPGAARASAARRGRPRPGLLGRARPARRAARRRRAALLLSRLEHRQLHAATRRFAFLRRDPAARRAAAAC